MKTIKTERKPGGKLPPNPDARTVTKTYKLSKPEAERLTALVAEYAGGDWSLFARVVLLGWVPKADDFSR